MVLLKMNGINCPYQEDDEHPEVSVQTAQLLGCVEAKIAYSQP